MQKFHSLMIYLIHVIDTVKKKMAKAVSALDNLQNFIFIASAHYDIS